MKYREFEITYDPPPISDRFDREYATLQDLEVDRMAARAELATGTDYCVEIIRPGQYRIAPGRLVAAISLALNEYPYRRPRPMTTKTHDFAQLASLAGWDLARQLGCQFSGDCNYTDHGGYFYDSREWRRNGYAAAVEFRRIDDDENSLHVSCGTINRPNDISGCLASCGWRYDGTGSAIAIVDERGEVITDELDIMARVEIDACRGHWGIEPQEDFGGPSSQRFPDGTDDSDILAAVIGWLTSLAE